MSEEKEVQEAPEIPDSHEHEPAKQRSGGSGAFLATLLALGALGGSYYLWQQLEVAKRDINAIEGSVDKLLGVMEQRHQEQLERLQHVPDHPHEAIEEKLSAAEQKLQRLEASLYNLRSQQSRQQQGGLVAEVEYLLRIAQHRLNLEYDTPTAIAALRTARSRLEIQDNPNFTTVIDQIGKDIDTLAAIELPDREALAAEVAGIAATVEAFPLANGDTAPTTKTTAETTQKPLDDDSWKAIWQKVWRDIRGLVTIRRDGEVAQPMLAPEQHYFLRQNLQLKLESARLALLSGYPQAWRDGLGEAGDWLQHYFDTADLAVSSALQTLKRLANVELQPTLPELSDTRRMLQEAAAKPVAQQPAIQPEPAVEPAPAVEPEPAPEPAPTATVEEPAAAMDTAPAQAPATEPSQDVPAAPEESAPQSEPPTQNPPQQNPEPETPAQGEEATQQDEGVAL